MELRSFGSFAWFTSPRFHFFISLSLSALAKTIALKKKIVFVWWKFGKFMILGFWVWKDFYWSHVFFFFFWWFCWKIYIVHVLIAVFIYYNCYCFKFSFQIIWWCLAFWKPFFWCFWKWNCFFLKQSKYLYHMFVCSYVELRLI